MTPYLGFLLVMAGWLLQWPTIPTLAMFPILAVVYARLARSEAQPPASKPMTPTAPRIQAVIQVASGRLTRW